MTTIQQVCQFLDAFAPPALAEDWDNVGLLIGDRALPVKKIMTCLTVTPETVQEAIRRQVDLLVSHHPLPFRPLQKITSDSVASRLVWELAGSQISVYSPHTAFDSTHEGINDQLAELIGLQRPRPLKPTANDPEQGAGRWGSLELALPVSGLTGRLKQGLGIERVQVSESDDRPVSRIGVACGSGGSFLSAASFRGCDGFITGEANFHTVLEARALGIVLMLVGHFASERFAVERLATSLGRSFSDCEVWASRDEAEPLFWR